MAPKGTPRQEAARSALVRTTVELPEALWLRAKQQALLERRDLRALIIEGLELVLAQKPKKGGTR